MRRRRFRRVCLGLAASTTLLLGATAAPAPAMATAAPEPDLATVQRAAHLAIAGRVGSLHVTGAVVKASPFMGDDAQRRMDAMAAVARELWALDAEIQADTTVADARADAERIWTEYRVYVLVLPVTHLTRAADLTTNRLVPEHERVADRLQDAVTSKDRADLQPLLDDMRARIDAADDAASPVPEKLASLTAAQWNEDHALLAPARRAMETSRASLETARDDARKIVAALEA